MIEIKNVSMSYEKSPTLDNISTVINSGSIFGLIGSNGSGKSTLLNILSGVIKQKNGEVLYDGVPVWENDLVKQGIIFLSDEQYFIPHSTINDMKKLYKCTYTDFSEKTFEKLRGIFALDCDKKINTFSKGMKKQAAVMLGISAHPKYLLCDETFDGLDPVVRQLVKRIIVEECADGKMTAIIASHNLREMEDICDSFGLLHKGELVFAHDIDAVKSELHKVQAVFNADFDAEKLSGMSILGYSQRGSVVSFIARGSLDDINSKMIELTPTFFEVIPLTLEEIFICEMEEKGYDFSKLSY